MVGRQSPKAFRLSHMILILVIMAILAWLMFFVDTEEQTRPTLMVEYENLFNTSYQAVILEAQLEDKTLGQSTVEIDKVKVNLLNGYPTPRAMLALLGLPDCSIEQNRDAICVTELNHSMSLSVSGKGVNTQVVIYPSDMPAQQWWQGCMLIYTKMLDTQDDAAHFGPQLYLNKC